MVAARGQSLFMGVRLLLLGGPRYECRDFRGTKFMSTKFKGASVWVHKNNGGTKFGCKELWVGNFHAQV